MYGLTPARAAELFDQLVPAMLEALETWVFRRPGPDGVPGNIAAPDASLRSLRLFRDEVVPVVRAAVGGR